MRRARSVLLLVLAAAASACGSEDARGRPSVILISIDTLRADHVGLYGYERDTTPFLDRFAEHALVFEHAFTPTAWTLPAHMTMLTGLFPAQHGVEMEDLALAPGIPTLAETLQHAGYQTVGLYRRSWVHERHGFGRGFDVFRAHMEAEEAGQHLREELARLDHDRPLFLFVHLYDVHNGGTHDATSVVYPSPQPYQDLFLDEGSTPMPDVPSDEIWDGKVKLTDAQLRTLVAQYDGGIRYVDAKLEEWFGWLEREGWLKDALVVVTADHGEPLGQRGGELGGHGGFAQEGLHVPLVVRPVALLAEQRRVLEPAHLVDVVPTVLDAAGLPPDARLPGESLLRPLAPDRVITGSSSVPPSGYVVRWPLKVLQRDGGRCLSVDLEQDPGELQYHKAPRELYHELLGHALPSDVQFPAASHIDPLPAAERQMLSDLGYAGGAGDDEKK